MSSKFKTHFSVAAIVCLVFLFILAPAARAVDKTVWAKFDNSTPGLADSGAMNGRIPLGTSGKGDDRYTWGASVIKDDSSYKMWYSGDDGDNYRIYYATSPDGLNWTKYNNTAATNSDTISTDGRIGLGTSGTGDDKSVYYPSVIKDGSTYKMWYTGNDGGTDRIYYASSPDGLTWTKKNNDIPADSDTTSDEGRIPLGTSGKGDVRHSGYPTVIKDGDGSTYKMWYAGHDGTNWRIYHATSSDGLNWTKYSNSVPPNSNITGTHGRIPLGTSGGDTNHVRRPTVILDDSIYRMWYGANGGGKWCIYNATSTDGLTWTKVTNAVPDDSDTTSTLGRIPLGDTAGRGDKVYVLLPTVIKDDGTYKMWYTGYVNPFCIYLATSTDSLNWTKVDNTLPAASDLPGNGRIPLGTSGKGDDNYVYDPCVIKDDSTYKMWYAGHDGTCFRIYYATSLDGLTWIKYDNSVPLATSDTTNWGNGRIPLGATGKGDDTHVREPWVIKDGSTYKMWYSGYNSGSYRIYYATSTNGLTWTKWNNTIPGATNTTSSNGCVPLGTSGGDTTYAYAPTVIKEGATYKMWYTGYDSSKMYIFYATSSNGLSWTKYSNSIPDASNTTGTNGRIPLGTSGGDTKRAFESTVIKDGSFYKQWYTGHDSTNFRIYYATSSDGLTWIKCTNAVPANSDTTSTKGRIPLGISGGDIKHAAYPCVIKDGYTYKMWYTGYESGNTGRIYHATCDQLPKGTIFYSH